MKMGDIVAYRTGDPEVVAEWDAWVAEMEAWHSAVEALVREWFGRDLGIWTTQFGAFHGVKLEDDMDLPEGWKWADEHRVVQPKVSTKVGKAVRKVLEANRPPTSIRDRLKGMPAYIDLFTQPGVARYGDEVWVTWPREVAQHDPAVWTQEPLSAYYLAKEADDAKPAPKVRKKKVKT